MATTIGDLQYTLSLDDKPLQRGARSAKSVLKGLDGAFAKMANLSLATQGVATFGRKLYEFGSTFVGAAADLEKLTQGLTAVAGSSREADEQLDRLRQVAKLPGLGLEEAVQGSINLQAVGLSAKQAEGALSAFGNALATVGKGKAELDGVILALTQMAAKGKISAEEINQIGERVPQIRAVMLEAFGTAVPQEIEKMGITADKFIDTVTAKLGALPSVAGGASNAFENLADATRGFQAQLGELILPEVTSMVNALAGTFETLSEAMDTPSEQIRDIATDFEEAKNKFDDQSESIKDLREEYDDLKGKIDNVNPGTKEAARLNTRLQGVITNLISLVPQLAGKLDLETSSFKDLNATIATNLELRRSMLTAEFVTGLDRFTQQVDAAQKRMDELNRAQAELAGLGDQRVVTDAGATRATGLRVVQTEGGEQLSATAQQLVGDSTRVADVLVKVRQEMVKTDGAMDLLAVKFAQVAEAAGEDMVPALRDLAQLQSLGASAAVGEYNEALGIMAQRLNLSRSDLAKFLPLINQIPEAAEQAADGLDGAGDSAKKAMKAPSGKMVLGSPEYYEALLNRQRKAKEEKEKLDAQAAKQAERAAKEQSKRRLSNAEQANDLEWDSFLRMAIKIGQAEAGLTDTLAAEAQKRDAASRIALAKRVSQFEGFLRRIATTYKDAQTRMAEAETLVSPISGTTFLPGGDTGVGDTGDEAEKAESKLREYLHALADVTDATAELSEASGKDGLAGSLDLVTTGLDILVTGLTQGPIMAALHGVMAAIQWFTKKAREEKERMEKLVKQMEEGLKNTIQTGLDLVAKNKSLGESFVGNLAGTLLEGDFSKVGQAVESQLRQTITEGLVKAVANTSILQTALSNIQSLLANDIIDGTISESTNLLLGQQMATVRSEVEKSKPMIETILRGLGFDTTQNKKAKDRQSGLSVAIKQITTRQADELAFILRTSQGLSQQIAINTERTASSLEEWLPFMSERLDNLDRLPGAAAAANGGGAEGNIQADRQALGANFIGFQVAGLPA